MRRFFTLFSSSLLVVFLLLPTLVFADQTTSKPGHPIAKMLGEKLSYDVSFLWFKRLAAGTISLSPGPEPGQYIALLEARTLGLTAFLTRDRVEKVETLMEIGPDGLLRPLVQNALTIKGEGSSQTERVRSYHFNYDQRAVFYKNWKTGKESQEKTYPMDKDGPVYDLLSAFYNVRAGMFGPVVRGDHLALPTFTRRGTEDIVIARVVEEEQKRHTFFPQGTVLCKVLVDPDTFGTNGRDVFVGLDDEMVPRRVIVKNVIGLGDVRGVLKEIQNSLEGNPPLEAEEVAMR